MGFFGFGGLELDEAPKDAVPVCPYCKGELKQIWYKSEGYGGIGEKHILMCPDCRSLLGYGLWR